MTYNPEASTAVYATGADVMARLIGVPLPQSINTAVDSPIWQPLLQDASRWAEQTTHRVFDLIEHPAEVHNGLGRATQIILRYRPVVEVAAITIKDRAFQLVRNMTSADEGRLYSLNKLSAIISLLPDALTNYLMSGEPAFFNSATTPGGADNITVAYTSGYAPGSYPQALVGAVACAAGVALLDMAGTAVSNGVQSFSADGISTTFGQVFKQASDRLTTKRDELIGPLVEPLVGFI